MADSELTLQEEVERGAIETPPLLDWSGWQMWRSGAGREPRRPLREPHDIRLQRESALWRSTMLREYGAAWRRLLQRMQAEPPEGGS